MNVNANPNRPAFLHVADVAQRAGVTPATVRYYSRIGLLHPGREADNDYRLFSRDDLHRVTFTRQAQALGLTIGDVKEILDLVDEGESPCEQVRGMVERRLAAIREQIETLQETERRIRNAVVAWNELNGTDHSDGLFCPLIESVEPACHSRR